MSGLGSLKKVSKPDQPYNENDNGHPQVAVIHVISPFDSGLAALRLVGAFLHGLLDLALGLLGFAFDFL